MGVYGKRKRRDGVMGRWEVTGSGGWVLRLENCIWYGSKVYGKGEELGGVDRVLMVGVCLRV
jgi:hypothetical protein